MSKALEHFWRWAIGERPKGADADCSAGVNLSDAEYEWLAFCAERIADRALPAKEFRNLECCESCVAWAIDHHPEALRDMATAYHDAYQAMADRVPKAEEPAKWKRLPAPRPWSEDAADALIYGADFSHDCPPEVRKMWEPPRMVIGSSAYERLAREWGVTLQRQNDALYELDAMERSRPQPIATPQADGAHMLDRMCHCGRFIIKTGGLHACAHQTHQEHGCIV